MRRDEELKKTLSISPQQNSNSSKRVVVLFVSVCLSCLVSPQDILRTKKLDETQIRSSSIYLEYNGGCDDCGKGNLFNCVSVMNSVIRVGTKNLQQSHCIAVEVLFQMGFRRRRIGWHFWQFFVDPRCGWCDYRTECRRRGNLHGDWLIMCLY